MKKKCCACKTDKSLEHFDFKNKALGVRHVRCKPCQRTYGQAHYRANKSHYSERNKAARKKFNEKIRKLKEHPCADCGILYPYYVMDFDHLQNKLAEVSYLATWGQRGQALEEIKKCEVVCSNCHRERTYRRELQKLGGVAER
jgi:hypothetical protein